MSNHHPHSYSRPRFLPSPQAPFQISAVTPSYAFVNNPSRLVIQGGNFRQTKGLKCRLGDGNWSQVMFVANVGEMWCDVVAPRPGPLSLSINTDVGGDSIEWKSALQGLLTPQISLTHFQTNASLSSFSCPLSGTSQGIFLQGDNFLYGVLSPSFVLVCQYGKEIQLSGVLTAEGVICPCPRMDNVPRNGNTLTT